MIIFFVLFKNNFGGWQDLNISSEREIFIILNKQLLQIFSWKFLKNFFSTGYGSGSQTFCYGGPLLAKLSSRYPPDLNHTVPVKSMDSLFFVF